MCYMLELYINHNNTIFISGSFLFLTNPDLVKICYEHIQSAGNQNLFSKLIKQNLERVGTSETIRTQKTIFTLYSLLKIKKENDIKIR